MERRAITRRVALQTAAGLPVHTLAAGQASDPMAAVLAPVCLREFAGRRGCLALARVAREELIFASNPRELRQTLSKPGSTVKPFLLRHLLERGLLREDEVYPCSGGPLPFAGRRFDCSHAPQGAPLDLAAALALSCNRCFLHWAERLSADSAHGAGFAEQLRQSGFSDRRVFAQQTATPSVTNPATREEMLLQALGESNLAASPLTLLNAYRRLLRSWRGDKETAATRLMRDGMHDCIRAGTGYEARVPGLDLAGKTGTATSPGRRSLNGWMLSFHPATRPELVMVVYVENGRGGVEAASITGAAWRALRPELAR